MVTNTGPASNVVLLVLIFNTDAYSKRKITQNHSTNGNGIVDYCISKSTR